jgi:hypothetical protein
MGIDFSVEGSGIHFERRPHWSYSGFGFFREQLAAEAGIELGRMYGFYDFDFAKAFREGGMERVKELDEASGEKRSWDEIDDPIKPLLNHSDCDGQLTPEECATIAPRLRELVSKWPDMGIHGYDREHAERLADLMDRSVELNVPLQFC